MHTPPSAPRIRTSRATPNREVLKVTVKRVKARAEGGTGAARHLPALAPAEVPRAK